MPMSRKLEIKYRECRAVLAKASIEFNRELRLSLFPNKGPEYSSLHVAGLCWVGMAVLIGQAEGKPMNATKIAHFLEVPRPTVLRVLKRLIELGGVERKGNLYFLSEARARARDQGQVERFVRNASAIVRDAASKLDALEKK